MGNKMTKFVRLIRYYISLPLFVALGVGLPLSCFAEPVVSDVVVLSESGEDLAESSSRTLNTATKIRIVGSGFGEKTRGGPPILWDRVGSFRGIDGSYRYGEGVGDAPYETGSAVSGADLRQPWAEVSYAGLYGKEDNAVYVKEQGADLVLNNIGLSNVRRASGERSSGEPAHYVVNGPQGFLGKPREYGGKTPPPGSDYLYVSWWIKQKHDPVKVSTYTLEYSGSAKFSAGDRFLVEGTTFTGKVLGFPTSDPSYANVEFSSRDLIGSKSLGRRLVKVNEKGEIISGDTAVSAIIRTPNTSDGSNKFIRIWDNPNGKNFRFSWTSTQLYAGAAGGGHTDSRTWFTWNGIPERWNHAEVEVDLKVGRLRAWVNNEIFADISLVNSGRDPAFSPTVSLLGWDGQYQYYQVTQFGDIYVDNSLQRLVVSNKPTWVEASIAPAEYSGAGPAPRLKEVQYPLSWSDTSIDAEIYVGAYEGCSVDGLYLYVSNSSGVFNEKGYKLPGKACPVAPKIL